MKAVAEQNLFAEVLGHFIEVQNIPLRTDPTRIGMYVVTLASDIALRDDLFLACTTVQSLDARFVFGSITDVTPENVLSPIWLRAEECMASLGAQEALLPDGPPAVRSALEKHDLVVLPRVSLKD